MKKFTQNDIFVNTLKVYPKVKFFTYSGSVYYNNLNIPNAELNNFLREPFADPPEECAILAQDDFFLVTENNKYLMLDGCPETPTPPIIVESLLTEEGETLITEDNLELVYE